MPRPSRPWFRRGREMFYVQVGGVQYPLGVSDPEDTAGADAAFKALLARLSNAVPTPPQQVPSASPTVAEAVSVFLTAAERKVVRGKIDPRSVRNYRLSLVAFAASFGPRALGSLTAEEIEDWAARPEWSSSYQNTTLGTVGSLLRENKVVIKLQRPPKESRGAASVLTDEQFRTVLANVYTTKGKPGDLVPLLRLLRECGARPSEVAGLTVESIDWTNCIATLTRHKSKRKTGLNRSLVFNSEAMRLLRVQRAKYATGLLFRTRGGGKAYGPNVIVKQLLKVSKRVGFRVIAYSFRHAFATRALIAGVPETVVAALLGHRGTAMLHSNYSHVSANSRALADAAERAATPAAR